MQYPLAKHVSNCYSARMDIDMEQFRQRVERLRKERGLSARALSMRIGQNEAYVQQLESGLRNKKPPGYPVLKALADEFGISIEQLLAPGPVLVSKRPLTDDELFDKIGAGYVEDIPFIEDVLVSAGPGSGIPQDIDDTLPKGRKRRYFKHLRSLIVTGRCLEPDLCPGDLVHIDRDRAPVPGKFVVAVRDEEEALIKRLVERDGEWNLAACDGRPEIPVDERIRILGPVVAFQRGLW